MKIPKSEAEHRIRSYDELEEKHWSECVQISQYEEENKILRGLLIRAVGLLRTALWVNYRQEDEARVSEKRQRRC